MSTAIQSDPADPADRLADARLRRAAAAQRGAVAAAQPSENPATPAPKPAAADAEALDWTLALKLIASVADAPRGVASERRALELLRLRFGAERAVLMPPRGNSSQAISPSQEAPPALCARWAALRDEAQFARGPVFAPATRAGDETLRHHHSRHLVAERLGGVATLTLRHAGAVVGHLILERRASPFDSVEMRRLRNCAGLIGPWLGLEAEARRSAWGRVRAQWRSWTVGESRGAKWLVATLVSAAAAVLVVAACWRFEATVTANARIEGSEQRELIAPMDGYLKAVHARPGDVVVDGALLAELDDRELSLETDRLAGEVSQENAAAGEALAHHDRSTAMLHQAKADEAQAQSDLAALRLRQTAVRAPYGGVVVAGDLRNRVGGPVKRGDALFSIAPAGRWRVVAEVPEREIGAVRVGAIARVVLAAEPGRPLALVVRRVSPIGHEADGAVTFEVEAEPRGGELTLRPGLSGVARIEVGRRPAWRIVAGGLLDALRLAWWRLGG